MTNITTLPKPSTPLLKFKKLRPEAHLPKSWSDHAVGYDLHALLLSENGHTLRKLIPPCSTVNVPTGLAVEPPPGHYVLVLPRSGLGKHSISVTNSPGLIDPDYRGEIMVLVYNGSYVNQWIEHDQRIAQLIVVPLINVKVTEVTQLSETGRGTSGFGSTGV
jgi:dUTP pyrophosphatase